MAHTALGMVFLYEPAREDVAKYGDAQGLTPLQRVRWLLERIASKSSSGGRGNPSMLAAAEVATLTPSDVESLLEIFLASPQTQRHSMRALEGDGTMRAPGEAAVDYFDRLMAWRARNDGIGGAPMGAGVEPESVAFDDDALADNLHRPVRAEDDYAPRLAASILASQKAIQSSLMWATGAIILALFAMSAGAAWLAHQSYMRGLEVERKNETWQRQMKMFADNNSAMERGFTDLATENERLRARLETLERRPKPAPPKAGVAPLPRKAPEKPARPPPPKK